MTVCVYVCVCVRASRFLGGLLNPILKAVYKLATYDAFEKIREIWEKRSFQEKRKATQTQARLSLFGPAQDTSKCSR